MKASVRLVVLLSLLLLQPVHVQAQTDEQLVQRLKKTVVTVHTSISHGLNAEGPGRFGGTGFIVDAQLGIIATNRHVAHTSPSQAKVVFDNGESAEAHVLHYDAHHDFAFYKVDVSRVKFPLVAAELGSSFSLKEQDEVFLIGNNEGQAHSVKFGRVTNLVLDMGSRHTATLQTSFDRAGGSSGSPVFNRGGQVVGIHFAGTDTTSFEMRIEYLKDALAQLRSRGKVRRGEIGVELGVMFVSDARKHFHLPEEVAQRIQSVREDIKRVIYISRIVPRSPAKGVFSPGDVVVEVDGRMVGDDLYLFDKLVDAHVGKEVSLTVYRNGKRVSHTVAVLDAETTKIEKFALFAGGVLHDLTPELRRQFEIDCDGTFLSQANRGTSFSQLGWGTRDQEMSLAVVIEAVNGIPTPNLEAFIEAVRPLKNQDEIYVTARDYRSPRQSTAAVPITLQLKSDPLKIFTFTAGTLDWIEDDARPFAAALEDN